MVNAHDITAMLKAHGVMPTRQRLMIARVLFECHQHVSADQILGRVNSDRDRVSKATVYNTVGLFARKGLVREVIVDPSRVFYDTNTSDHHHFYNIDTGELQDIEASSIECSELPELPEGTVAAGVNIVVRLRNESTVD